jgi:electron transfer flavoprotein alpha/beta subunit
MRILVAFKVTPDYEALRAADWATGPAGAVETRFVRRILNCFDESALELALRLGEQLAQGEVATELGAVSVGGREVEPQLATLYALGYGRTARIETEAALDFVPGATAALLAAYARRPPGCDLLLLGCRGGPGDSGTVPFLVAEELGWPCASQVTEIAPLDDGRLQVIRVADDGLERVTLRPPCVLAVGNAVVSHLRVPALSDRLALRDRRADVFTPEDLGVDPAAGTLGVTGSLIGLEGIDRSRAGVVLPGETPRDAARALLASHLAGVIGAP